MTIPISWLILPAALVLMLIGPVLAGALLLNRKRTTRALRRSPLTADLLRGPGHSIRQHMDDVRDKVDEYVVMLMVFPLIVYTVHLTQSYALGKT